MATLHLSGGKEYFTWRIDALSEPFNSINYICAGICTKSFSNGASSISGDVDDEYTSSSSGSSTSTSTNTVRYSPGTYTFYGYAQASNGLYYNAGSGTVTITSTPSVSKWSWSASNGNASAIQTYNAYEVLHGTIEASGNFSHLVWNDIVDKAYETITAAGYSWRGSISRDNCKLSSGSILSASVYNSVKASIDYVRSTGITNKSSGDIIYGTYIETLTDTINKIINNL